MHFYDPPKTPKSEKKTNVEKVDPQRVEKNNVEKVGLYILIYLHILSYTFIYLHIPPNSFIYTPSYTLPYIKILNIRKMRANIKHKKWS